VRQRGKELRCVPYLRCSTDDQKHGDFTTVQVQREINTRHIESIGGVKVAEYNDEGRSGTTLNRPDWKRLLADARAGMMDAVVVTYMSRLARGGIFHAAEYLLGEAGVQLILVREDFTEDLNGYMNKNLKVFMDGCTRSRSQSGRRPRCRKWWRKGSGAGARCRSGTRASMSPMQPSAHPARSRRSGWSSSRTRRPWWSGVRDIRADWQLRARAGAPERLDIPRLGP